MKDWFPAEWDSPALRGTVNKGQDARPTEAADIPSGTRNSPYKKTGFNEAFRSPSLRSRPYLVSGGRKWNMGTTRHRAYESGY